MANIPFGTTDWSAVERTVHAGETGTATWRTQTFDGIRVRMVEYSPGYLANHWCSKGHILLCLDGELHTELADGRVMVLRPGMTYGASDEFGFHVAENPVHVHDLQATILHLMGFDHERLTHRFQGREFRLTDVFGKVVKGILA